MAPKKKRTRKGTIMSEHHRRNLELLFHGLSQSLYALASLTFMMIITAIIIYLEGIKGGRPSIEVIFVFSLFIAVIIWSVIGMVKFPKALGKILREIGAMETAKKYKIPIPKAKRHIFHWTDIVIIVSIFTSMFVYLMWLFY